LSAPAAAELALALVLGAAGRPPAGGPPGEHRGLPFWSALARTCSVPEGESAAGLVNEAVGFLGSPDSRWRDDVGYGVVARCIYVEKRLSPAERRALKDRLVANLRVGIGDNGTDSVLLRSFSALDLSVLAAAEVRDPVLDEAAYRGLLDAALAYLRDERDLRGLSPTQGWIHATAHTADLLKFLARDSRFAAADQARLLEAVWSKLTAIGTPVFTHSEDERLASALVSVARRPDFDGAALGAWLARFPALEKRVWEKAPPDPGTLDASQNARDLLESLFVALSQKEPAPTGGQAAARDQVLATLSAIRR
jgi:hypothetical protein